jgi:hypothetical protein
MPLSRERKIELLGAMPLFEGLDADDLGGVADRTVEVDYGQGGVIVREGEIGTGFFVIVSGQVRVCVTGRRVSTLGPASSSVSCPCSTTGRATRRSAAVAPTTCLALGVVGPRGRDHRPAARRAVDAAGARHPAPRRDRRPPPLRYG